MPLYLLAALFGLISAVFTIFCVVSALRAYHIRTQGVEVLGTVVAFEDDDDGVCTVVAYQVNGVEYQVSSQRVENRSRFPLGSQRRVCFMPTDPGRALLVERGDWLGTPVIGATEAPLRTPCWTLFCHPGATNGSRDASLRYYRAYRGSRGAPQRFSRAGRVSLGANLRIVEAFGGSRGASFRYSEAVRGPPAGARRHPPAEAGPTVVPPDQSEGGATLGEAGN